MNNPKGGKNVEVRGAIFVSLCRIVFIVAALGGLVVLTSCTAAYSMLGLLMFLGKSLGYFWGQCCAEVTVCLVGGSCPYWGRGSGVLFGDKKFLRGEDVTIRVLRTLVFVSLC